MLGVRSVNRLKAVKTNKRALKKKIKHFIIPRKFVNFKITKVITMIEIAKTVRKPVFIPKTKKIEEIISAGLATDKFVRSIFSGDWKRGTLRIALIKNKINKVTDTVFR